MKFGGSILSSKEKLVQAANIIRTNKEANEIVCVISAAEGITDGILSISEQIKKRNRKAVKDYLNTIMNMHYSLVENIEDNDLKNQVYSIVNELFYEFEQILNGLVIIGEVNPKSMDYILSFGERLATPIVSFFLKSLGNPACFLDGKDLGILTDSNFGEARPLMNTTKLRVAKLLEPKLRERSIPVVTGFIGTDQNGNITTLGRGGSDYIATILAASIHADEVWLFGDVEGFMTADPKMERNAKVIREISFAEAMEISMFGSKYMHPRALEPVIDTDIPVRIKNISKPDDYGTLILQHPNVNSLRIVKSINTIRNTSLIDVGGLGLVGIPGTAARVFEVLAKNKINIIMISQNPSESSISMIVRKDDLEKATVTLELNLLGKLIKNINIYDNVAIIAVVGSGMRGIKGVAARVFNTVASKNVNVIMITQGSSELNLAFVVSEKNCEEIVQALHEEFDLANINL